MNLDAYDCLGDLTKETMDYFKSLQIVRVDEFIPYYHASLGCHILNLYNRNKNTIYVRTGMIPDLRLNLFFVGPPGFSKSFFCNIHFDPRFGAASKFPNKEVAYLTLPALVGTVSGKDQQGNPIIETGAAELYKEHIIWCEEFTSISEVMKVEHSAGMAGMLLMLTDNGKVLRGMRYGEIEYQSYATLMLGTQTERLDLASGLARRFLFLDLNPTSKDIVDYNRAWEAGEGISPNFKALTRLNEGYLMMAAGPPNLKHIRLTNDYLRFRSNLPCIHIDKEILNRLAIGWNFMNRFHWNDSELVVEAPSELRALVLRALEMKYRILGELNFLAIEKLMEGGEWYGLTDIKWSMVKQLGIPYSDASKRIAQMLDIGLLAERPRKRTGPGRPGREVQLARRATDEEEEEVDTDGSI